MNEFIYVLVREAARFCEQIGNLTCVANAGRNVSHSFFLLKGPRYKRVSVTYTRMSDHHVPTVDCVRVEESVGYLRKTHIARDSRVCESFMIER